MTFTLNVRLNADRFERAFREHRDEMRRAFVRGLDRSAELIEKAAKINLTSNNSIAFGSLRASLGHKTDPDLLRVTIGPGLNNRPGGADPRNYGFYVEEGRGPGRAPPKGALDLWIKRKLGVGDGEEIARLAFLIGRRIARSGTTPAPFLVPALKQSEPQIGPRIERELDRTIQRINARRR